MKSRSLKTEARSKKQAWNAPIGGALMAETLREPEARSSPSCYSLGISDAAG